MRLFSYRNRPVHLSHFPLERLPRTQSITERPARLPGSTDLPGTDAVAHVIPEYLDLFRGSFDPPSTDAGTVTGQRPAYVPLAPAKAPIPDDPQVRADNLKASAYFIDASMAGICRLKTSDWDTAGYPSHTHAFVMLVEFGKEPRSDEPGAAWTQGSQAARGDVRAAEIAGVIAGYLRQMGFDARAHVPGDTLVGIEALVQRAGLALPRGVVLSAPFIGKRFRAGVVTTDYEMAADLPLRSLSSWRSHGPVWWLGLGGADSWLERWLDNRRRAALGRYPMESIKRVDKPTTLVLGDEIKRSPMRASGFSRARYGDFGAKVAAAAGMGHAQRHPLSKGMGPIQGSMIPRQGDGLPLDPTGIGGDLSDPTKNAAAIKTLGYFMGADFVGICRAEPWMFYSHDGQGNEIDVYHKYVVVMLIDQGHETMEGASGDDWISGSQSMRGYMRGAEIAGIMASHCRRMGYSSRAHTNSDSQILHNPAILMSGLGEISRIGDTMLNPFIGPRSKSVLFSTDLPLAIDLPIDAGVQQFCESCSKCARECPCNAIPFGPKVMFNGYETWRMDAVKCTSYRITNEKGSFCGRCMKMCPWNTEGLATHRAVMWLARKFPMTHAWIARMDDKLLNGSRNLVKRWWFDLDVVDGVCVTPGATNERDLNLDNAARKDVQKLSLIPPEMWPSPDETTAHPIDRAAAIRFYEEAELPEQARRRSRQKSGAGLT
ncbi:MAG: reductive dehalogenase [Dehalococcoidia bacterium]